MSSIAQKLQDAAKQRAAAAVLAQNRNLATGVQTTANAVQTDPTEGIDASKSQQAESEEQEQQNAPEGGYEACAIKSLFADNARFYPVDGYFFPQTPAQVAECERWVGLGMIVAPKA